MVSTSCTPLKNSRIKRAGYLPPKARQKGHCLHLDTKLHDYGGVELIVARICCLGEGCIGPTKEGFLLHVMDGRVRVWQQPSTTHAERNIVETVAFGDGSVMVWDVCLMTASLT